MSRSQSRIGLLLGLLFVMLATTHAYKFSIVQGANSGQEASTNSIELDNRMIKFIPEGYLPYPKSLTLEPTFRESSMIARDNTATELCDYVLKMVLLISRKSDTSNLPQKAFFLNGLPECSINPSSFSGVTPEMIPMTFVFLRSSPALENFKTSTHPYLKQMNIGVAVLSETKFDELKKDASNFKLVADFSIVPTLDFEHLHQVEVFSNLNSLEGYVLSLSASHFAHKFRMTEKERMLVRHYILLGKLVDGPGGLDLKNNKYCSPFYGQYCVDLRHYGLVADMDGLMKYIAQIEYQEEMWPGTLKHEFNDLYINNCLKHQQETLTACLKRTFEELPKKVDQSMVKRISTITNSQNKEVFTSVLTNTYSQIERYHLTEEFAAFPASVSVVIDGEKIEGRITANSLLKILCKLNDETTGICSPTVVYHPKIENTPPMYPYKNITVVFTLILTVAVVLYTVSKS